MTKKLTLEQISEYLLRETLRADNHFQLLQSNLRASLRGAKATQSTDDASVELDDIWIDMSYSSTLFLEEVEFVFKIAPVRETFWEKVMNFLFRLPKQPAFIYQFFQNKEGEVANSIDIKISIKRNKDGTYNENIKYDSDSKIKPKQMYVRGFT